MQLQEFKSALVLMEVCESLLKPGLSQIPTSWMSSEMRNECHHQLPYANVQAQFESTTPQTA